MSQFRLRITLMAVLTIGGWSTAMAGGAAQDLAELVDQILAPFEISDKEAWKRHDDAYERLISAGKTAASYLRKMAQDERQNLGYRRFAIKTLGDLPSEENVSLLKSVFVKSEDPWSRECAAVALARQGDSGAISFLVSQLADDSKADDHAGLYKALANVTNSGCVSALSKDLDRQSHVVITAVQESLAKIGTEDAAKALERSLSHAHPGVRHHAADLLGDLQRKSTVNTLRDALAKEQENVVRVALAASIVKHDGGDTASVTLLRKHATSGLVNLRAKAIRGLSEVKTEENVRFLRKFLYDSDPGIRAYAIDAFANVATASGLLVLDDISKKDDSDVVREHAKKRMEELKEKLSKTKPKD